MRNHLKSAKQAETGWMLMNLILPD